MRTAYGETVRAGGALGRALPLEREQVVRMGALGAIVALAAGLRLANLSALGYANHYYAAAVESMLQSWHNFFFVAAEPGGAVSVDKPPVGLWIQTISARFLGVDTLGLLLPEILAGLLSILVVYHLVRRSFGTVAGLLAALALAITPVVVATDRNNTIDSILILTLLLAAWAFIVAAERASFRHLLLGAILVGIGFNIKMLEAFLPLPAFYALYFLGAKERLLPKVGKLAIASVVLAVVSLSWVTIVDLTPADQRPYVGSSGDNSEMSLAIGYNGVERLLGMGGRGGLLAQLMNRLNPSSVPRGGAQGFQQRPNGNVSPFQRQPGGNLALPPQGPGANAISPQQGQAGPGGFQGRGQAGPGGLGGPGGGMFGTGQAGPLRLFTAPLGKEASWLLPFGLFGMVLLAFRARPRWPLAPKHQAIVLWGGWLVTGGVFFSVAGFFHEYYLSTLGAPLAALVGAGSMEMWGLRRWNRWIAAALLIAAAAVTLKSQVGIATAFTTSLWWQPIAVGLLGLGAALLLAASVRSMDRVAAAGFVAVIAALLITPGIWSGLTTLNSSSNQSLPAAYSGRASGPANSGGLNVNQTLLNYLQSHTQGTKYLVAVPSSMQGADYVLATGRPVLYLGGFMGQDKVVTAEDLSRMVADGELRYIYWNSGGRGGGFGAQGGQSDISAWVAANCTPVQGFDTETQNSGAPDGTSAGAAVGGRGIAGGFGGMQVTLYQCNVPGSH